MGRVEHQAKGLSLHMVQVKRESVLEGRVLDVFAGLYVQACHANMASALFIALSEPAHLYLQTCAYCCAAFVLPTLYSACHFPLICRSSLCFYSDVAHILSSQS